MEKRSPGGRGTPTTLVGRQPSTVCLQTKTHLLLFAKRGNDDVSKKSKKSKNPRASRWLDKITLIGLRNWVPQPQVFSFFFFPHLLSLSPPSSAMASSSTLPYSDPDECSSSDPLHTSPIPIACRKAGVQEDTSIEENVSWTVGYTTRSVRATFILTHTTGSCIINNGDKNRKTTSRTAIFDTYWGDLSPKATKVHILLAYHTISPDTLHYRSGVYGPGIGRRMSPLPPQSPLCLMSAFPQVPGPEPSSSG